MLNKKVLVPLLALSLSLTSVSAFEVNNVSAAATDDQFSSLALAKGYKDLNEKNPCMTQRFTADPGVMEYNGRVYVYTTNDAYEYDSTGAVANNSFNVQTLNCMSSSDMVNWTDHGKINVAGSNGAAKWAGFSWAPTACHKTINGKEKFFLYFANNANGIGVLTSDSPTGPWTDPIGHELISRSTENCSNVTWLFDPAVLIDSDGTGYLYFGGGIPSGQDAHPKTSRVVKLGSDMISLAGTPSMIDAPYMFEDSGINKIGNTYYYSYCTNWASRSSSDPAVAAIAYMTSSSPTGPFTYQGTVLNNPATFFGIGGTNHHTIAQLDNKLYIFYHTQWLEKQMGTIKGYRCVHVDNLSISNGKISSGTGTLTGVAQTKDLNPYVSNPMATMAWQGGINVTGSGNTKVEMNAGDWVGVSNVGFGTTGATSVTMRVASQKGAVIKVCTDSTTSAAAGYVVVPATGSLNTFTNVSINISKITGTKKLFFVSSGDCAVDTWQFSGSSAGNTSNNDPKPTTTIGNTVTLSDGWYYIKNVNAQKYLQVAGNIGKAAQNVELGTGSGLDGQKWYLTNVGNGYITLKSALGDFMLDVSRAENNDGTNIQIYNAYANDAQKFSIKSSSTNGAYAIATMVSNDTKVLDDYKFQTADGTNVCQWTYGGKNNQLWVLEKTTVSNKPTVSNKTIGDINSDGKANAIDYALLKSYLLGTTTNINSENADINEDGNINAIDFALLKKMLLN